MDRASLLVYRAELETLLKRCDAKSCRICVRCLLRLCNAKHVFTPCGTTEAIADLRSFFQPQSTDHQSSSESIISQLLDETEFCPVCLDTLSDRFIADITQQICADIEAKKRAKYLRADIANFRLQILLPIVLTLRNHYFANRLSIADRENTFTVKEVFKALLASRLGDALAASHRSESNFVIELNFAHPDGDKECEQLVEISPEMFWAKKCRKSSVESFVNHSSISRVINLLNGDEAVSSRISLHDIVSRCTLPRIAYKHEPIYIAGRYMKFSRTLSQTPWIVDDETTATKTARFIGSVQERICDAVRRYIDYDDIKFSASGREDVDVRMLGRGRPFLLELLNPRPRIESGSSEDSNTNRLTRQIEHECNFGPNRDVRIRDLQTVDREASQRFLKEGEQNKTKTYRALCCIDRPITDEDLARIGATHDLVITQKTPIRVLHRRTLADRQRTIYRFSAHRITDTAEIPAEHRQFVDQIFALEMCTEAGTYVKEFVHSDFGRTTPNLCVLLGDDCATDIIALDVLEVNLDWPPTIDDYDGDGEEQEKEQPKKNENNNNNNNNDKK